jgi:starch-binding outer membrane protein, SusD/RagB family
MKNKLYKLLIYSFSCVLLINTSCEDFVKGVDEFDPTLPRDANYGQVITAAEVSLIGFAEGDLARLAGMFTDQFTGVDRQYVSLNNYTTTAGDYDAQWDNIYANCLKSLRIARSKALEVNDLGAVGLTQILEAYLMGTTASLWGDIPFSQAANIEQYPNPAYESQRDVYSAILAMLDEAITNINESPIPLPATYDIFGGGNEEWIARANTLKAKFNLHLGDYAKAVESAREGIKSPDGDILGTHGSSYNQDFNIYYSFLTYDRPGYMSADFAVAPKLLDPGIVAVESYRGNDKTDETARFLWYYSADGLNSAVAEYDVNVLSAADGWVGDETENGFFAAEASFPILTYGENQLILAEALLRTGDAQGALNALNSWRGVLDAGYRIPSAWLAEGSNYDPYDITDFAAGGIENASSLSQNDALYREIIEEKYVTMIGTLEVFTDMRRKGFGSFAGQQNWQVIGLTPNTGSEIPQRFLIPQTELNSNTSAPDSPPGLFERTEIFN